MQCNDVSASDSGAEIICVLIKVFGWNGDGCHGAKGLGEQQWAGNRADSIQEAS